MWMQQLQKRLQLITIMHPPHKKNVFPPVANPIEQGCQSEREDKLSAMYDLKDLLLKYH